MNASQERVHEAVIHGIQPTVGRVLSSVVYAALAHEIEQVSDLATQVTYIGGELVLRFDGLAEPAVITWAENAGWPDHFSVRVRGDSAFNPGALVDWPANSLPAWRDHVGRPLTGVRLYAKNDTPHLLELVFPTGSVLVGDGVEYEFGDGDDIIVRAGSDTKLLAGWQLLWASP